MLLSLLGDEFDLFMFTLEPTGLSQHQNHIKIMANFNPAREWFLPERTVTLTSYDDRYPLPSQSCSEIVLQLGVFRDVCEDFTEG